MANMNNTQAIVKTTAKDQLEVITRSLANPETLSFNLNLIWAQVQEYKLAIRTFQKGSRYHRLQALEISHVELRDRLAGESLEKDETSALAMLINLRARAKRIRAAMKATH